MFIYVYLLWGLRPSNIYGHIKMGASLWLCTHIYGAAPLGDQSISTMTWYLTQSHYPTTELTSLCPILLMSSVRLDSDEYQCGMSLVGLGQVSNTRPPHGKPALYQWSRHPPWKSRLIVLTISFYLLNKRVQYISCTRLFNK